MRLRMTLLVSIAALLAAPSAAAARSPFTKPVKLAGATGGEPSIASDPLGDIFVVGPQGIPSGANGEPGVGLWVSRNDGASFPKARHIGSLAGGGDSDVLYSKQAVYIADLEATASQVCKSTDRGNTFDSIGPTPDPSHCSSVGAGQVGPSDDREWLTADPSGTLYLTYHEFISAQPLAFRSDNGGKDLFRTACGAIVTDPRIQANIPTDVTGGTLVARPVTDKAGNLYILFTTTTQAQNAAALLQGQSSGTFSQLYLAVSHNRCKSFTDYTVFDGSKLGTNTVQFGDIFNNLAIDGAGNLYAVGAGYVGHKPFATTTNAYLFRSFDHGKKWLGPKLLDSPKSAHMLPAATGGPSAGQLAVGYFRTVNAVTDPNSLKGKWTYSTAETSNARAASPKFVYRDVKPGYVYHNGQICNAGVLCGTPGQASDRSLLDFTSVALDSHACALFTFAGNPKGTPTTNDATNTFNYVTRQRTGCFKATVKGKRHGHRHGGKKHHPHPNKPHPRKQPKKSEEER